MHSVNPLPAAGLVRLPQIIGTKESPGPVPVSKATWYAWIREGRAPKPVKNGSGRAVFWKAEDVQAFIDRLGDGA